MAKISRLGGAILASTEGAYYLIGDLKEPLAFENFGFKRPEERDVKAKPYIRLETLGPVTEPNCTFVMNAEGEALAQKLAAAFVIVRNASVSERLWSLAWEASSDAKNEAGAKDINWLGTVPGDIWDIVRDSVLRCS